ncbi:hypothetical protein [Rhodohalobacter sulfatireducens]|uniref:Uncharacterized protein n=1 Tax=Rhodohalobacter sulfatireducens TaxID=2911366 RepID=A0ABS9KE33_9BACT|nr:hypothetical protein [Rhodohalobacter sulfatireducens]MCG2589121.1 hypothetical protein [Rhodohalobacter sulfatireducens]
MGESEFETFLENEILPVIDSKENVFNCTAFEKSQLLHTTSRPIDWMNGDDFSLSISGMDIDTLFTLIDIINYSSTVLESKEKYQGNTKQLKRDVESY